MIPKAGKSSDDIKGWRPITLLNIDFKIISSAVSARLQNVVGNLIDHCQTVYIKGRFIGENTRLVYDVINHLSAREGTGIIMSVDFEAAFDSLSWDFVGKVLSQYGFGPRFNTRTGKGGRFCPPLMFFVNIFRSIRSIAVIFSIPAQK